MNAPAAVPRPSDGADLAFPGFPASKGRTGPVTFGRQRRSWGIYLSLAIVGAALFVMMIRALTQGYPMGAAFVAAFMLLGGWQLGRLFWRNRPRRYDPNAIPDELLPPG